MLGVYFAPLIAPTKAAMCEIPFTESFGELLTSAELRPGYEPARKQNWNRLNVCDVGGIFYLLHGREAGSLWLAAPCAFTPEWGVKLARGCGPVALCSLWSCPRGVLLLERCFTPAMNTLHENNGIVSNQSCRFYVEMFLAFSLLSSVTWLVFFPTLQNFSTKTFKEKLNY